MPSSEEEWNKVKETFQQWNFPNCIGAVDGKHVVMDAPPNAGSIYYNYKNTHSIVLMAICDGNYKFIYVDVGSNGRISDGGVFNKCSFVKAMENGSLHLPEVQPLPGCNTIIPSVLVADDAFALKPNLMKPYPGRNLALSQRVYNYRLSRARRCIENAFGIMSARFRVLRSPVHLDAVKTRKLTLACCALHNFLFANDPEKYTSSSNQNQNSDDNITIALPKESMYPLEPIDDRIDGNQEPSGDTNIPRNAIQVRKALETYFMSDAGKVDWQFQQI